MRRTTTTKAAALTVAAAVGFGCSIEPSAEPEPIPLESVPQADGAGTAATPVGPTYIVHGVPQGWRHDAEGARAAAISAVRLTGEVAKAGFITRGDMIDQVASRRFAPDLAVTTERQLADLTEALGEAELLPPRLTWSEVPLTARVAAARRESARVEIWSVLVVASPDVGVPRQAWRTVSVDLVWEAGDWKVDGWAVRSGPTPALAAATAASTGDAVAETAGWRAADGPRSDGGGERDAEEGGD